MAQFSSVAQSFWLFVTPWTAVGQASLSITNSWSLLKLMSIKSVMPSNHLIPCHPLLLLSSVFPSIGVFSNESVLPSGGQSIGASALASVLTMNIQDWFPLGLTCLTSLQSKGLSWSDSYMIPGSSMVKNSPANAGGVGDVGWIPGWVGKIPWRRKWQPTQVSLTEKSNGQRSLVGYSPWVCKESDVIEQAQKQSQDIFSSFIQMRSKSFRTIVCIAKTTLN